MTATLQACRCLYLCCLWFVKGSKNLLTFQSDLFLSLYGIASSLSFNYFTWTPSGSRLCFFTPCLGSYLKPSALKIKSLLWSLLVNASTKCHLKETKLRKSTSAPLLLFALSLYLSVLLGSGSSTAIPSSLQYSSPALVSLTGIHPTPAQGSSIAVHSDTQPTTEPTLLSQTLRGASSRSGGSSPTSSSRLEPSLAFQEPGLADDLQSFLFQDYASKQSLSGRYCTTW